MTVKTITITQQAYEQLKGRKMPSESFSEVILRTIPKTLTANDLFGLCPGTEDEAKAEIAQIKKRRKEMSKELDERIKRVSTGLYGTS